jgi:basic membrane lipoprotein Med (substrate-binding protein (PBP1-ABC) superfamily)
LCPPRLILLAAALLAAGCGPVHHAATTTTTRVVTKAAPATGLPVGVVGDLVVPKVFGAQYDRGTLTQVAGDALVLVPAGLAGEIAPVAAAHPSTHFALVGASTPDTRLKNVAGLLVADDQAARLAGVVAGVVAADEGIEQPQVAWAGPEQPALVAAFGRGVHLVEDRAQILHAWSVRVPSACKEAALAVVDRGAVAVLAPHGICADAAVAGAHEQNVVGLTLDQFESLQVPAAQVVRDAVTGIYHGGEDVVFGARSGAIGIGALDPRITAEQAIRARTLSSQLSG